MTFGSALEFSHYSIEKNGILRKAPWAKLGAKLATGSGKHGLEEWPAEGAIRDQQLKLELQPPAATNDSRPPPARP